jgi:two-component system, chemotaxis family, sensor kinase CheA
MVDTNSLKQEFLVESFENLANAAGVFTQLEKDPHNRELLNSIYRTIHTLKGSANFLGFSKLGELTHCAENVLDLIRENVIELNGDLTDALLATTDLCVSILNSIEQNDSEGKIDVQDIIATLKFLSSPDAVSAMADNVTEAKQASSIDDDNDISMAALDSIREQVEAGLIDQSVLDDLMKEMGVAPAKPVLTVVENKKIETPVSVEAAPASVALEPEVVKDVALDDTKVHVADSTVRVNVSVLDKIMNLVGELVLNRNQLVQLTNKLRENDFLRLTQQLNIITSELQSEVMATRMQPVGNIIGKFERLVRDMAKASNKKIKLVLSGQETELDRTLLDAIKDPLVHIIRNACDHGLEEPAEREKNKKDSTGTLSIRAYNESGQVTIEIADDGRGLYRSKLVKKAKEKQLYTEDELEAMSDSDVYNIIFHPGFSTAEKITNVSGRGVGMDVVKTNIELIGGSVQIENREGYGVTFKLRIPLTLAIIPALIIADNSEFFAIPQINLVELVRLESTEEKSLIEKIQENHFLRLRGKLTPLFSLSKLLKLPDVHDRSTKMNNQFKSINKKRVINNDAFNIVILNAEGKTFGLMVDEILDTEEIVVKALNAHLKQIGIFGGASIMGDGRVALILDAVGFISKFSSGMEQKVADLNKSNEAEEFTNTEVLETLLFKLKDGLTYAFPLNLVSRLEEFKVKDVEYTGKRPIMRYLNQAMPLIVPDNLLKLSTSEVTYFKDRDKFSCVVCNLRGINYGIIVDEIIDIAISQSDIDSSAVDRDGVLGILFIQDKAISLIDLYFMVNSVQTTRQTEVNAKKAKFKKLKILLVDDSVMYRKMESDALMQIGHHVVTANHGEDGFQKLASEKFDLIVTDIEMPVLDGYGFAEKVRSSIYKNIPIIAISTRFSRADIEKGEKAGFSHHLEKFKKDELFGLIETMF